MRYLWIILLTMLSFLIVSCDLTTDDLETGVTDLAVSSLSTEVIVEAIDTMIDTVNSAAVNLNPYFKEATFTTAGDGFVSVVVDNDSFVQSSDGTYEIKVSSTDVDPYTASLLNAFNLTTVDAVHVDGVVLSFNVNHPQTAPSFLRFGESRFVPLVFSFSSTPTNRVSIAGPFSAKQSVFVGSRSYNVTVGVTSTAVTVKDYYTTEVTTGSIASGNATLCVDDLVSGSISVSANAAVMVGSDQDVPATYTSSGKVDFTNKYAYVTVPDIKTDGTVNVAGETNKCIYFGTETASSNITSGVPATLLPTGESCDGSIINLLEVREETFYECARP